ncbi:MAG: zinc ribbon domain-containing protein [Clostridia bacterium]|nr:zinc ribbon domain-containing protein [Clostridia bacterium]
MAKFCNKCGAQLDDSAQVCGICGAPLESDNNAPAAVGGSAVGGIKAFLTPARLKIGGIALAGIAVLIVLIIIISSFTGANGVQRKMINAYKKGDGKALAKIYSQVLKDKNEDRDWEEYFEDRYDDRKYEIASVKVIETHDYNDAEYKKFLEENDLSKGEVSKVREVIVKIKRKNNGASMYDYDSFIMTKEKKGWRVYSPL